MPTNWITGLILFSLVISGIVQIWRGSTGALRRYDASDAICAAIEIPLLTWGVIVLAQR